MFTHSWSVWSDTATRGAIVAVLICATALGDWGQRATASTPLRAASSADASPTAESDDPVDVVFAFRDDLGRVQWQLGFEPDARDGAELATACADVIRMAPGFRSAVAEIDGDLAAQLREAAHPTIELCHHPLGAGAAGESAALAGYGQFWEAAFDVVD